MDICKLRSLILLFCLLSLPALSNANQLEDDLNDEFRPYIALAIGIVIVSAAFLIYQANKSNPHNDSKLQELTIHNNDPVNIKFEIDSFSTGNQYSEITKGVESQGNINDFTPMLTMKMSW